MSIVHCATERFETVTSCKCKKGIAASLGTCEQRIKPVTSFTNEERNHN